MTTYKHDTRADWYFLTGDDGTITNFPAESRFYADMEVWVAAGGVIDPADQPTFTDQQDARRVAVNDSYTLLTNELTKGYPENEQKTWPVQIMESSAILNNAAVDTPWIDGAAAARGITPLELAGKIRDMDVAYRDYTGRLTGARQKLMAQIDVATTTEELDAIVLTMPDPPPADTSTEPPAA